MSSYYQSAYLDPLTGMPKKKAPAPYNPNTAVNNRQGLGMGGAPAPTGGGYTSGPLAQAPPLPAGPNYRDLIDNDPLYAQAKLDFGAQGVSDAAQRAALTQRALTLFGQVPEFGGLNGLNPEWLQQDVTDQTRQMAQQNTDAGLSIVARQDKSFKDQIRAIRNNLAARGGLQSGEFGHQLQDAQLGRDQARFDTTEELTQFIQGLQAGYVEKQRVARLQQAQAAEAAAGRVQQQYPGQPAPPPSAPLPVGSSGDYLTNLVEASRRKSDEEYANL